MWLVPGRFGGRQREKMPPVATEKAELGNEVLAAGLYKKSLDSLEMLMNAQICRELGVQSTEIAYGNLRYRDQKIEIGKLTRSVL